MAGRRLSSNDVSVVIALAIVVFSNWTAAGVVAGAWLFGGVTVLQLRLQAAGVRAHASAHSSACSTISTMRLTSDCSIPIHNGNRISRPLMLSV